MNFTIVFTKNRKKFDKYVKVNRIKNKIVIDINDKLIEYNLVDEISDYQDYFNLLIYTKINQTIIKKKDIFYIPNFHNKEIKLEDIFKIKNILKDDIHFNILFFYDEFRDDIQNRDLIMDNIDKFDASQILRSY